jgi:biofilm PGA synthesis N-glycosyltransferase PgaC
MSSLAILREFGSIAMQWGWIRSALKGLPRYQEAEFRRFLRRYHRRVVLVGKKRALEELGAAAR